MKAKRYTDEEIRDIKKWREEGLTWAEISDRNGRSADAMQVKFSTLKRGVPEYKKQEIPPVIIPEGVSSFNERKAATGPKPLKQRPTRLYRRRFTSAKNRSSPSGQESTEATRSGSERRSISKRSTKSGTISTPSRF